MSAPALVERMRNEQLYSLCYKRYVVALLLLVYVFNQTDRIVFGFLMESIKGDLALSDTQLGFLAGPALALFYCILGVPIARLADRSHRVNIMSIAIALWSGVAALTATVGTFSQLVLTRIGVGIGEAGFSAIAQSLIADYHATPERTRALSIFMLGIPLGVVASFLLGGWFNQAYGWRATFIAAGVPGLILAVLMKWTVREPPRGGVGTGSNRVLETPPQPPLRQLGRVLWQRRALRHLAFATALANTVGAGVITWIPALLMRNHGMSSGELGTWLALIVGVGGSVGTWLGGYLTSRCGVRDKRIKVRLVAFATALVPPIIVMSLWSPSTAWTLWLLLPSQVLMFFFFGPTVALVQELSASNMRATMASVFLLIQVLAGGMIGVLLLGVLSDAFTPMLGSAGAALKWSMTLVSLLAWGAAAHFWMAGRTMRQDLEAKERPWS